MKRAIEIVIFLFVVSSLWGQSENIKVIYATIGYKPDFSPEGIKKWENGEELWDQFHYGKKKWEDFTPGEKELLEEVDEFRGLWDVTAGKSGIDDWYCGGGPHKITASSCLPATKKFNYVAEMPMILIFGRHGSKE